jgi:hypothetical protein
MRKGVGSILGIIIMIGVLFNTFIPLQLYIKEHKLLKIQRENELEVKEGYRDLEDLTVLAYPVNTTSNEILVEVENKGAIQVNVKSIWIKDSKEPIETGLRQGEEGVFGPFTVDLIENNSYPVQVFTERGRLFSSESGNLFFIEGTWVIQGLGISVQIANNIGKYFICVSNSTWSSIYQTQGQDHDDLLVFFDVKSNGNYQVVCKKNNSMGPDLPGTPMIVELMYPGGPPVVSIYTSGLDL